MVKTYQPRQKDQIRDWHQFDAKDKVLGRLASEIARILMGKHKTNYSAHMDMGDYVVVTNVTGIVVTGRKAKQKLYRSHSGFPGGFREVSYEKMSEDYPEKILELAVAGMLPKNRLRDKRLRRLKVYKGNEHKYQDKFAKEGETKN